MSKNTSFPKPIYSRREFLRNAAIGTCGMLILPSGFLRGQNAPSNRIAYAAIGVGGQGDHDSGEIAKCEGVQVVGICDVDRQRLSTKGRREKFTDAKPFEDYREMLATLGDKIDAVSVSTPDHMHFSGAYDAISMGKHVYVQKPLAHTVDQCRRLKAIAKQKGVITQMGNQGSSIPDIYITKAWYEEGLFGDVKEAIAWTNRPVWAQGYDAYKYVKDPEEVAKKLKNLNWDLWLGCAKGSKLDPKEYANDLHPFAWRGVYAFGCGALGDMAAHVLNTAYNVFELTPPDKIEVEISKHSPVAFPDWSKVHFHFPKTAKRGPLTLTWYDGASKDSGRRPAEGARVDKQGSGSFFKASKVPFGAGEYGDPIFTTPAEKVEEFKKKNIAPKNPVGSLLPERNHYKNWIESIKANKPALSSFEKAADFAEIMLLGCIAQRMNKSLEYDIARGQFKGANAAEANKLIKAENHNEKISLTSFRA